MRLTPWVFVAMAASVEGIAPMEGMPTEDSVMGNCTGTQKLEVMVLQDQTVSFERLLEQTSRMLPQFVYALREQWPDVRAGLAGFTDKPQPPRFPDLYCYHPWIQITDDMEAFGRAALGMTQTWGNGTPEEVAFDAWGYAASTAGGFTPPSEGDGIIRIVVIITDNPGQHSERRDLPGFPERMVCEDESDGFPSIRQLKDMIAATKTYPVVLTVERFVDWWDRFLRNTLDYSRGEYISMNVEQWIYGAEDDAGASQIIDTIAQTVSEVSCNVEVAGTTIPPTTTTTTTTTTTEEEIDCCAVCY
eukprot:Gregarina_sp_Poly_1__4285@NODE_232_length_11105_cov_98_544211_g205_i0_p4_GENE_NODE_232_length_11105_cov_98_544211_g205_i0NODE_232_length_11105_cov_98_544211_g205_i0_p4_ORF_typecomplete_len303_score36_59Integrin_beta/PF00362_18/1_1e11_NODE_232_length_11105_cov_98_544211_g205_i0977910687